MGSSCNSQLDPWFCAEFRANSPSLLLLQCYLYLFYSSARKVKTFVLLFCVCSCNIYLYGLRNLWQISFHIGVASLSSYQILTRQLLEKQPDCGVWKQNKTKLGVCYSVFTTLFFVFTWPKIAQSGFFNHPWQWLLQGEKLQATWDEQDPVILSSTQRGVQLYFTWQSLSGATNTWMFLPSAGFSSLPATIQTAFCHLSHWLWGSLAGQPCPAAANTQIVW